ncbi:MAG: large subunit ribosomal protein [Acidobacteriota bacterium]|jgi:large subunit ribosomal protein L22|nr:large subunit ribosomal protein [Acidobacteriota bacterium]
MEAIASAKYLRGSAQKARLVVDMIRGKRVGEALAILQFTNKRAADAIEKCLRSAIANATETAERQNVAVDPDDLVVKACFVNIGPTKNRRRVRPAPQGRAYREQRHFCHVTVQVATDGSEEQVAGKTKGKKGSKPATAAAKVADAKPASPRKGGAKKVVAAGDAAAEKTTTKRASKKAEAAPAEESKTEESAAQE